MGIFTHVNSSTAHMVAEEVGAFAIGVRDDGTEQEIYGGPDNLMPLSLTLTYARTYFERSTLKNTHMWFNHIYVRVIIGDHDPVVAYYDAK